MDTQQQLKTYTSTGGVGALVFTITTVTLIALLDVSVPMMAKYPADVIFPSFVQRSGSFAVYSLWMFTMSQVMLIGFGVGLSKLHSSQHESLSIFAQFLIVAATIFMMETIFTIGLLKGLAPVVLSTEEPSDVLKGTAYTLISFRNYTGVLAGMLVALSSLGFGIVYLNHSSILGYWAISAGTMGIAGAFWPVYEILSYLRNAGYMLFIFWVCATSILLMKEKFVLDKQNDSTSSL